MSVTTQDHYDHIVGDIEKALDAGGKAFVHCWGGVGRTGTVVGIWHVMRGHAPDAAIARIRAARAVTKKVARESPETEEQRDAIRAAHGKPRAVKG